MKKKKKIWIALAFAVLVIGVTVWLLWPTEKPISIEMYQQLRIGMSLEDVEAFFGVPGSSRQDFVLWAHDNDRISYQRGGAGKDLLNKHREEPGIDKYWFGGTGAIVVRFDFDAVSTDKQFLPLGESGTSFRQRLRRLLGL